jgi:hypothetical protein
MANVRKSLERCLMPTVCHCLFELTIDVNKKKYYVVLIAGSHSIYWPKELRPRRLRHSL